MGTDDDLMQDLAAQICALNDFNDLPSLLDSAIGNLTVLAMKASARREEFLRNRF